MTLLTLSDLFLSCTTVRADWGTVFDLENPSWLLLDGKIYIMLFIVGDLVCLSLRLSVIVLVGKPLKAKGSGHIISFEVKLVFCSFPVVSVFI